MLVACALFIGGGAHAESYPAKMVRVVIGYPAGAGNDVIGRMVLTEVSKSLSQPFVVDNRPGASGTIGAEIVARSAADGYTLLNAPGSIAMSYTLLTKLPYDLLKDLQPIAVMATVPFLLGVHPSLPAKSVRELIALGKARPVQLTFGSGGAGGGPHLTAELFKMRTGLEMLHVPYRGTAQGNAALASGEITMIFAPSASIIPLIHTKRVSAARDHQCHAPSLGARSPHDDRSWPCGFRGAELDRAFRATRNPRRNYRAPQQRNQSHRTDTGHA
jgi:tripartite-type tricarboxylate transporter receptor subunit TctC